MYSITAPQSVLDGPDYNHAIKLPEIVRALYDKKYGIIRSIIELGQAPEFPGLRIGSARTATSSYFRENQPNASIGPNEGGGAGFTRESCMWSTVGEAVERFACGIYHANELISARPAFGSSEQFPISEVIAHSADQYKLPNYPFTPIDSNAPMYWCRGYNLVTSAPLLVPANMVYFGINEPNDQVITQTASTGTACGSTYRGAISSGLREVLERDVFSAMWLLQYRPQRIRLDEAFTASLSDGVQSLLRSTACKFSLWYLPNEFGAVTVLACSEGRHIFRPAFGAACAFSLRAACEKAIIETCHTWLWASMFSREKIVQATSKLDAGNDLVDSADHVAYYLNESNYAHLDFLMTATSWVDASELEAHVGERTLEQVMQAISASGRTAAWVDITPSDIATVGLRTTKVLISRVQHLQFGNPQYWANLDTRRLKELAKLWGIPMPERLNLAPHPFP